LQLVRLLTGEFSDTVSSVEIVDCRFDYEFDGGHIQSAVSINSREAMQARFFTASKLKECSALPNASAHRGHKFAMSNGFAAVDAVPAREKHVVVVFHCEFSASRGPKMSVKDAT
jgi:M-phase inducer tyrosine phosphatase